MNKIVFIAVCLLLLGCVNGAPPSSPTSKRDELIRIAKLEIEKRHIHLPADCTITVHEGVAVFEPRGSREEYIIQFAFIYHGKQDVVYKVAIDKQTRKVNDFMDYRNTVPGG
jgi:hypothetical protein